MTGPLSVLRIDTRLLYSDDTSTVDVRSLDSILSSRIVITTAPVLCSDCVVTFASLVFGMITVVLLLLLPCFVVASGRLVDVFDAVETGRFDLPTLEVFGRECLAANKRFVALFTKVFCCFGALLVVG